MNVQKRFCKVQVNVLLTVICFKLFYIVFIFYENYTFFLNMLMNVIKINSNGVCDFFLSPRFRDIWITIWWQKL